MRTRIIIVALGLSLGLGGRFGYDYYLQRKTPSQPAAPAQDNAAESATKPPPSK